MFTLHYFQALLNQCEIKIVWKLFSWAGLFRKAKNTKIENDNNNNNNKKRGENV